MKNHPNLVCKQEWNVGLILAIFDNCTDDLKHGCYALRIHKKETITTVNTKIILEAGAQGWRLHILTPPLPTWKWLAKLRGIIFFLTRPWNNFVAGAGQVVFSNLCFAQTQPIFGWKNIYSQLFCSRLLCKIDTLRRQTPRVGPYLSSLLWVDSLIRWTSH